MLHNRLSKCQQPPIGITTTAPTRTTWRAGIAREALPSPRALPRRCRCTPLLRHPATFFRTSAASICTPLAMIHVVFGAFLGARFANIST